MKHKLIKLFSIVLLCLLFIESASATLTTMPVSVTVTNDIWDGRINSSYVKSTTAMDFGFNVAPYRAFIRWDTSGLPDDATITKLEYCFKVSRTYNGAWKIYSCENDPSTATGATLWNDLGDGNEYYAGGTSFTSGNWYTVELASTARTALTASLASTHWFGLGLKRDSEAGDYNANNDYNSGAGNAGILKVTYNRAGFHYIYIGGMYLEDNTGPSSHSITIGNSDGTTDTYTLNSASQTISTDKTISYLSWDAGTSQYRILATPSGCTTPTTKLYEPEAGTTIEVYLFYFRDLSGFIGSGTCYLETYRNVGGSNVLLEKKEVTNTINGLPVYFARNKIYTLNFEDSDSNDHDFGYFLPIGSANQETTLILQELQFDQQVQFAYTHLAIVGTRSADKTEIEVTYADDLDGYDITDADIVIKDRAGNIVFTDSSSSESDTFTKTSLSNTTDYVVFLTFEHEFYGSLKWTRAYEGFDSFGAGLDFDDVGLGVYGIEGTELAGLTIIIFVAGIFTTLNAPVGIFATVLTAGLLARIGWLSVTDTLLGVALCLAVIFALTRGGRN